MPASTTSTRSAVRTGSSRWLTTRTPRRSTHPPACHGDPLPLTSALVRPKAKRPRQNGVPSTGQRCGNLVHARDRSGFRESRVVRCSCCVAHAYVLAERLGVPSEVLEDHSEGAGPCLDGDVAWVHAVDRDVPCRRLVPSRGDPRRPRPRRVPRRTCTHAGAATSVGTIHAARSSEVATTYNLARSTVARAMLTSDWTSDCRRDPLPERAHEVVHRGRPARTQATRRRPRGLSDVRHYIP